jgi:hypothetical protein
MSWGHNIEGISLLHIQPLRVSGNMNVIYRKLAFLVTVLLIICFAGGCGGHKQNIAGAQDASLPKDLGETIGSLVDVIIPEPIPVEGFGLVVGLENTGSAECPPEIRTYLRQYILKQLPATSRLNVDEFIGSPDTAVVSVEGVIPAIASKDQYFDVRVAALPGTQTTSLDGGRLFTTELKMLGSFGVRTRILADAEGPVYVDKIDDGRINKRTGHILAGGKVLDEYKVVLALHKPDFRMANRIRNRINGRFGDDVAKGIVSDRIDLIVPPQYKEQKQRFISIVAAMYLTQEAKINNERIKIYVQRLSSSEDPYPSEVALEAIGNECLDELGVLLDSSDEKISFHAARCMLNLGSDAGLAALRRIAQEKGSACRIEALESIGFGAKRNDAVSISRKLLRDDDFQVRLAAYEQLRRLDDVSVTQEFIGRNFYLEQVSQTEHKAVFVSRSGQPRIVIFGAPIYCSGNIFVQSRDGDVTINAPEGQQYVNIIRKHPKRPDVIAQLRSSFELCDIIRTLCNEPAQKEDKARGGLGASYSDAAALLKKMCDMGVVDAEFHAGPMPKIGLNIKK